MYPQKVISQTYHSVFSLFVLFLLVIILIRRLHLQCPRTYLITLDQRNSICLETPMCATSILITKKNSSENYTSCFVPKYEKHGTR